MNDIIVIALIVLVATVGSLGAGYRLAVWRGMERKLDRIIALLDQ